MSIKVDTVTIETDRGKIEFTIEELKDLQKMLNELFGKDKEIIIHRQQPPYWLGAVKYGDFNEPNRYTYTSDTSAQGKATFQTHNMSCSLVGREI